MNFSLFTILITPLAGGTLAYLGGKISRKLKYLFAISFASFFIIEIILYRNIRIDLLIRGKLLGSLLLFGINDLSWFFSLILGISGLIAIIVSFNEEHSFSNMYLMLLMFLEGASFGLLIAQDILTFFIFFCTILFLTYVILVEINHGFSLKFLSFYFSGAFLILLFIMIFFKNLNSFSFVSIRTGMPALSDSLKIFGITIIIVWFFILAPLFPFNLWFQRFYSKMHASLKILLLSLFKNIGIYFLIVLLYDFVGLKLESVYSLRFLGISGSITFIISGMLAFNQKTKEQSIIQIFFAETGLSIIGLSLMDSYGITSSMLTIINQFIWIGLFPLTAKPISYNFNLLKRLRFSKVMFFITLGLLSGVPLTLQFISRWLLLTTLLERGQLFYIYCVVLGSAFELIAIYRIAKTVIFEKQQAMKDSGPYLITTLAILLFAIISGIFPQYIFGVIHKVDQMINYYSFEITFNNIASLYAVQSKIIFITTGAALFTGFIFFTLIPWAAKKLPEKILVKLSFIPNRTNRSLNLMKKEIYNVPARKLRTFLSSLNKLLLSLENALPLIRNKIKIILIYFIMALALISLVTLIILRI